MARRSLSTILATLIVAVMVGVREASGIAPPPPTLSTEEIEWLSPELDHDLEFMVVIEDPGQFPPIVQPEAVPVSDRSLMGAAKAMVRRMLRLSE